MPSAIGDRIRLRRSFADSDLTAFTVLPFILSTQGQCFKMASPDYGIGSRQPNVSPKIYQKDVSYSIDNKDMEQRSINSSSILVNEKPKISFSIETILT